MKKLTLTLLLLTVVFTTIWAQKRWTDSVYVDHIKTVLMFPSSAPLDAPLPPPIIALAGGESLILKFDDLAYDAADYQIELIHCDADWEVSKLKATDYLTEFNQFRINQYEYSINTRIPYVHYTFRLPNLLVSGNYILKAYQNSNPEDVLFTKRFMIFEPRVSAQAQIIAPNKTSLRLSHQQVNVEVYYPNFEVINPQENLKISIRQNQRWDNAKKLISPTFAREDRKLLEFRAFEDELTFPAGNEFRFVDLRTVNFKSRNVADIIIEEKQVMALVARSKARGQQAFAENLDINGQYVIQNRERGNSQLESEYVYTTFELEAPKGQYQLLGALSNWGSMTEATLKTDPNDGVHYTELLLKQGWYDFIFEAVKAGTSLEGNFFQTENEYDIIIYYRDFGGRYDQIIGYTRINPNQRRLN